MKDKKTFGVKALAALAAVALALGCVIGGTMAWLTAQTTPVTNTFTTSDIGVTLAETTGTDYKMIPGYTITKDPKVTVTAGSEKCYLFVKVEESANFGTFMEYSMADGWIQLTDINDQTVAGVFYRIVESNALVREFGILAGDTVTVRADVTKEMMTARDFTSPTLKFTAYAFQYMKNNTESFTAAEAWAKVSTT